MTIAIPIPIVEACPPRADELLGMISPMVTDDMLEEISRADYGVDEYEIVDNLQAIRDKGRPPTPRYSGTMIVMEIIRWSQPDRAHWKPGSTGERGHIMRAFCCAALLRAGAVPRNQSYLCGENQSLIQLIDSVLYLGRGLPEAAGRFLTWRMTRSTESLEWEFFAFGLVALMLLSSPGVYTAADVDAMALYVEQVENDIRDPTGACTPDMFDGSFWGTARYALCHDAWHALAGRLRATFPDAKRMVELARRVEADI